VDPLRVSSSTYIQTHNQYTYIRILMLVTHPTHAYTQSVDLLRASSSTYIQTQNQHTYIHIFKLVTHLTHAHAQSVDLPRASSSTVITVDGKRTCMWAHTPSLEAHATMTWKCARCPTATCQRVISLPWRSLQASRYVRHVMCVCVCEFTAGGDLSSMTIPAGPNVRASCDVCVCVCVCRAYI
jgi:hypothetical protein